MNKNELIEFIPWVLSFNPEWMSQVMMEISKKPENAKAITEDFLGKIDYLNTEMIKFTRRCTTEEPGSDDYLSANLIKKIVEEYYAEADKKDEMTGLSLKTLVVFDMIDMAIETEMKDQELNQLMIEYYTQVGALLGNYPDNMTCLVAKMHELEEFLEEQGEFDVEDLDGMDFDDEDDDDLDDNGDNIIKFSKN